MSRWTAENFDELIQSQYKVADPKELGEYKQTNADRIRAMSDEELAEFLEQFEVCSHCEYSDNERCTFENPCVHEFATAMALKWLQSEAE